MQVAETLAAIESTWLSTASTVSCSNGAMLEEEEDGLSLVL